MGIFNKRPSLEQRQRLRSIKDPSQRKALLAAIKRGEPIPDYAWTPLPPQDEHERQETSRRLLSRVAESVASADESARATLVSVATEARAGTRDGAPWLLGDPLLSTSLPFSRTAIAKTTIAEWGVFHPLGPTVCWLATFPVPDTSEHVMALRRMGPAVQEEAVYGLLPGNASHEEVVTSLRALFMRNRSLDVPLLEGPPSYVSIPSAEMEGAPLSRGEVGELFWAAMADDVDDGDLTERTSALRIAPDPRERVGDGEAEERRNRSVARSAQVMRRFSEMGYSEQVERMKGTTWEEVEAFYAELAGEQPFESRNDRTRPLQTDTFLNWFRVVTDANHVEREERFTLNAQKRQVAVLLRPRGIIIPAYEYSDD